MNIKNLFNSGHNENDVVIFVLGAYVVGLVITCGISCVSQHFINQQILKQQEHELKERELKIKEMEIASSSK